MRDLQHVLWRGAMALSLMVAGIGGGYGLYEPAACPAQANASCLRVMVVTASARPAQCFDSAGDREHLVFVEG